MRKLLLIDGNALMHRAYHGMPPLSTATGEQVNAVFGFMSLFLRAFHDLQPDCVVFAFDRSGPTFRHHLSADYKATRQKMDEDLAKQIPRLKEVVAAFGLPVFELDEYEADDIIGTIAHRAYKLGDVQTFILTADMDATQLVNDRTSIYTAKQKLSEVVTYDVQGVMDKYSGLTPSQIVDYKALRGDTSDNIPGVPGIGEKTATQLLIEYKDLDSIYRNLDKLKDRTKELLEKGKESSYLSKKLATIEINAPLEFSIEDCHTDHIDSAKVAELFHELEFRSLVDKIPNGSSQTVALEAQLPTDYRLVVDIKQLEQLAKDIGQAQQVAFDTESTSLSPWEGQMIGASFSFQEATGFYVPLADWSRPLLASILADPSVAKIGHNAKFDIETCLHADLPVANVNFDTMLAAFLLKEGVGRFGLKELAFSEFGINATPISQLIGSGAKQKTMDQVEVETVAQYASADADHTWRLYQLYQSQFNGRKNLKDIFEQIEMPLSFVLAAMEEKGILVNKNLMTEMSRELGKQLMTLEAGIYDQVGHHFNINSPKQLAEVLFDNLGLPHSKKTKTGRSTDESVLQELNGAHPIVGMILQYRELYKLKSTYVDALPSLTNADGRMRTSYSQAVASTGRLSSSNPNLQNIPIRSEVGRRLRQAFIANPGQQLLSVDYSQIELRILAHVSQDPALLEAFKSGQDVHAATAAKVFNCPVDQVTPEQRRAAKTINFGIMYGQSAHGLAIQLGITRAEAAQFINDYFGVYQGVKNYLDNCIKQAHANGYVETLSGRKRRIPDLASSNFQLRSGAERMAINMPIQGTAADIIKIAMINIHQHLKKESAKSAMLLQVHDELVFTVDPQEMDKLLPVICAMMEEAMDLSVKLEVEAKVGPNWGEMTKVGDRQPAAGS
jgi:DNA polymerase-1